MSIYECLYCEKNFRSSNRCNAHELECEYTQRQQALILNDVSDNNDHYSLDCDVESKNWQDIAENCWDGGYGAFK